MDFGCDYYPEHWPEEKWTKDIQMMAEAGFNVVRLAEFAWSKLEPEEEQYDFDWLDRAIKILAENRIRVILGTPTATPPAWLARQYPTIFRVDEKGIRSSFGGRRGYCPNSSIYRDYSQRIVLKLAKHYQNNENVIGWQIDNEFGGLCYCEECAKHFRQWLKDKYITLDKLNQEWGTIFWSQTYTDWDEIPLPRYLQTAHNPSLLLDYRRFISDSYISYQRLQIDILRKSCPQAFITHNFMGLFNGINYYKLVIAPALFLINDELVENLKEFVKKGGTLIVTFRSGVKNWNNVVLEEPLPGKLTDLLGIEVVEYDSLPSQQKCKLKLIYPEIEPLSGECNIWCDIIKSRGAEVIGEYAQYYYEGRPWITVNEFGQRHAIYVGTNPSPEIKASILKWTTEKSGVRSSFPADSKDLEVVLRRKEGKNCLFFLNHSGEDNHVKLDSAYVELLENRKYAKGSIMTIEPRGVRILWET